MNKYNPNIQHRRSIRLKGYDYSQAGLYFITICVKNLESLFGNIENGKLILNNVGKMIENEWLKLPERFKNIQLHEYIIMPNHFHAILKIEFVVGATLVVAQNTTIVQNKKGQPQGIAPTITTTDETLGNMVGAFKSIVTNEYIRCVKNENWQRNYWEHIIRNENEYNRISQYIIDNPVKWENDKLNGGDGNIVMESIAEYNSEIWMI